MCALFTTPASPTSSPLRSFVPQAYNDKFRSLVFHLGENQALVDELLGTTITMEMLFKMSPEVLCDPRHRCRHFLLPAPTQTHPHTTPATADQPLLCVRLLVFVFGVLVFLPPLNV